MSWTGSHGGANNNFVKCSNQKPASKNYVVSSTLNQLQPSEHNTPTNAFITGVVVAKQDPRTILSQNGDNRCLLNFIFRDSIEDFINVTIWGSPTYVIKIADSFHIGDAITIENPVVKVKIENESEQKYRPWTPSPYMLNLNENRSNISIYNGDDFEKYLQLFSAPLRTNLSYTTLGDLLSSGRQLNNERANILAAVKSVGEPRVFVSKMGVQRQRCEVKLCDSTAIAFSLVLWDEEAIRFVQSWIPKQSVVLIIEARLVFDEFRQSLIAQIDSKSIIQLNPDMEEANHLYSLLVAGEDPDVEEAEEEQSIDLNLINTIYPMGEIKNLLKTQTNETVYCAAFAVVTEFDLDSSRKVVIRRCFHCKQRFDDERGACKNDQCQSRRGMQKPSYFEYDFVMALTDHTGTLQSCKVGAKTMESMLSLSAEEFSKLSEERRTDLKWKYLLERFKVILKVFPSSTGKLARMVGCLPCESNEFLAQLL